MSKRKRVKERAVYALVWRDAEKDPGWGKGASAPPWVTTVGFILKRPTKKEPWWKIADSYTEEEPGGTTIVPFGATVRKLGMVTIKWRKS